MTRYIVESKESGLVYGIYQAGSADDAIERMAQDFGYDDFAAMCAEHDPFMTYGYRRSICAHPANEGQSSLPARSRGRE